LHVELIVNPFHVLYSAANFDGSTEERNCWTTEAFFKPHTCTCCISKSDPVSHQTEQDSGAVETPQGGTPSSRSGESSATPEPA